MQKVADMRGVGLEYEEKYADVLYGRSLGSMMTKPFHGHRNFLLKKTRQATFIFKRIIYR